MNACEDQSEPLGEGPVDTLTAIHRGATLGILSAADEVLAVKQLAERQTQALTAIRALHTENYFKNCGCCLDPWPCSTIRAIDEAGA